MIENVLAPEEGDPLIWFGEDETESGKDAYLVLWYHHDGESHWCSLDQIRKRIRVIRETKSDVKERLARLTAIPWSKAVASAWKAYDEAEASAWKAYDEAVASAWKAYDEAEASACKAYDEAVASACKAFLRKVHVKRGNAIAIAEGKA